LAFFTVDTDTVTVTMGNAGVNGLILADGVILTRIGGEVPEGNVVPVSPRPAAQRLGETLTTRGQSPATGENNGRPEAYPTGAAYWNDELEESVAVLAEDQATGAPSEPTIDLPVGIEVIEPEALELALSGW
jgi:hypothetical protein